MAYPHTPTGVEIDGILIDGNRISRREYTRFIAFIQASDDVEANDDATGALVEKIVVHWPFNKPITKDGYLDLGLEDSVRVDRAVTQFGKELGEKKSSGLLTPPEDSSGLLMTPSSSEISANGPVSLPTNTPA